MYPPEQRASGIGKVLAGAAADALGSLIALALLGAAVALLPAALIARARLPLVIASS